MKLSNEEIAWRLGQLLVTCTRAVVESQGDPHFAIRFVDDAQGQVTDLSHAMQMEEPKVQDETPEAFEPYTLEEINWYIKATSWGNVPLRDHARAVLQDFRYSLIQKRKIER